MNISKQAIEAGAKAVRDEYFRSNGFTNAVGWDSCTAAAKEHWQEMARVGLTAAIPHLRGEGKQAVEDKPSAFSVAEWTDILQQFVDKVIPEKHDTLIYNAYMKGASGHEGGLDAVLALLHKKANMYIYGTEYNPRDVALAQAEETSQVDSNDKDGVTKPNPDDVARVARAQKEAYIKHIEHDTTGKMPAWGVIATAAIRAMNGQLFGVWLNAQNVWRFDHRTSKAFTTTDENAAQQVSHEWNEKHGDGNSEVRPYAAPREESAEEIAKRELQDIADNGLRCDTNPTIQITTSANDTALRYVQYIRQIDTTMRDRAKSALEAIREAEKRGAAKCG